MKSKNAAQFTEATARKAPNLAVRYGEIGISAVAAAMRYQGGAKATASKQHEEAPIERPSDLAA